MLKNTFGALTRNTISLVGTAIAMAAVVMMIAFFVMSLFGFEGGAYLGILIFVILPAIFFVGVVLVPAGIWWQRRQDRKRKEAGGEPVHLPVVDLNVEHTRKVVLGLLLLTLVSVVILAGGTYKAVHYMDSNAFCGTVCHTVMQPEYTAYQRSPHAQVKCADCHIGPGAEWFVKSKLSGSWQMVSVMLELYPTPIPTPVHDLRPARDTCEQCHWPTKFIGDKLSYRIHYEENEENTPLTTALLLKVGGQQGGKSHGIHWHVDPGVKIRYMSTPDRETIYDVELKEPDGTVKVFKAGGAPPEAEWREMDCVDCHNRPTHRYRMPGDEVDEAMLGGRISTDLPFIKREAVRALQVEYESHEDARAGLAADIDAYYRQNHADRYADLKREIEAAGAALGDIYSWNVFPAMKVTWGTYPDHSGHQETDGCFRCHNRKHETDDGERISRKCATCHETLAKGEENPEILTSLSISP